ncbi:Uncharacterized protein APZ42_019303 [Daphnia magna]|nr:Uncharacterized protein APZ42_019303 [Daphnia magna]
MVNVQLGHQALCISTQELLIPISSALSKSFDRTSRFVSPNNDIAHIVCHDFKAYPCFAKL